jgi:uncharacterized membrane protein YsdA (DUF1294 family)/cold shock CspA family protein
MKPGIRSGKLTKWKDDRGFGFIQPADGSQEVFLHISEVKDATRRPQENDTIYYHPVADSNGKMRAGSAFILGARNKSSPATRTVLPNTQPNDAALYNRFPLIEVILLAILPLFGALHFTWITKNPLPLGLYPIMSIVTYVLYASDKVRAQTNSWRIPERTLHLCELGGGWLGGFIAQRMLRHKCKKESYQIVFWAIVAIHFIGWLLWLLNSHL